MIPVGLRIDVDTLRGTCLGVPNLIRILRCHRINATFFFSVGPDNMGRHLWRMARPAFIKKMMRTRADALYGWDILLRGTFLPGPMIEKRCPEIIRQAALSGHEIGLHAWDHHRWQTRIDRMDADIAEKEMRIGWNRLRDIIGREPDGSAAPAWRITPQALMARERFPNRFNSDCRGQTPFRPLIYGKPMHQVQIPTTLPTYDEMVGRCCTKAGYNDLILSLISSDEPRFNVLTLHAEVEGIACSAVFDDFLRRAEGRRIRFFPLGDLIADTAHIPVHKIIRTEICGREGWISQQAV